MKKVLIVLVVIVILIALYFLIGNITMNSLQQEIDGKTAQVWNSVQRATEVLNRLEQQVTVHLKDRQDLVDKIISGRNGLQEAQNEGDINSLIESEEAAKLAINAIFEAYPDISLSGIQQGLMDETAGSLNRIAYARGELIDTQTEYNKKTVIFPFFDKIEITGSSFDPTSTLPPSDFGE